MVGLQARLRPQGRAKKQANEPTGCAHADRDLIQDTHCMHCRRQSRTDRESQRSWLADVVAGSKQTGSDAACLLRRRRHPHPLRLHLATRPATRREAAPRSQTIWTPSPWDLLSSHLAHFLSANLCFCCDRLRFTSACACAAPRSPPPGPGSPGTSCSIRLRHSLQQPNLRQTLSQPASAILPHNTPYRLEPSANDQRRHLDPLPASVLIPPPHRPLPFPPDVVALIPKQPPPHLPLQWAWSSQPRRAVHHIN